jgi:MFS family permease
LFDSPSGAKLEERGTLNVTESNQDTLKPASSSLWRPLQMPVFRNLLLSNVVSDLGTFMQTVGAAWLMVSLHAGPIYVALIQTASSLPFLLLALPAGSAGDILDRRKLILVTESWMTGVALVIAVLTIAGLMSPWLLLLLTFALSAGDAVETPSWRALLPELVSKDDLAAASALNGIEFNIARAVGPALAGALIAAAGIATAFLVNFASFFGVIVVVAKWKRAVPKPAAPAETFTGATVAALRYVRYSPAILSVVVRTGFVMFFSSALFALLPTIARSVNESAIGYGLLLGCFGAGAIVGALIMQWARARWSTEVIVSTGVSILGLVMVSTSGLHRLSTLAPVMLIGGAAWVVFVSLINALVQSLAPDWVRARVLAVFILVYQGGFALGSAAWGAIAQRASVGTALVCAGVGIIASLVLALFAKLPDSVADLSPWNHWRMPIVVKGGVSVSDPEQGPVLITVEYFVIPERSVEFVEAIHLFERIRRRDGASQWGIYRDTETGDRYLEIFTVSSWAEHQRQHQRVTEADHELEQRLSDYLVKPPQPRHLIFVRASESI